MDDHVVFLQDKTYHEALAAYNRNTEEVSGMKQRLQKLLLSVLRHVIQREENCLNILGVGCGDGNIDLDILEIIKAEQIAHCRKVEIFERAVDPNQSQLDKFQSSKKYQSLVKDGRVHIAFSYMTFEEYIARPSDEKKYFDLVHFILSIFNVTDIENCLLYTMDHLIKDNGKVLIVMTGEDVVFLTHEKQRPLYPKNVQFPSFQDVIGKIQDIANKQLWKCDLKVDKYVVDIAKVFDEQSREGNLILDCFTNVRDFRCSVDHQHLDETIELMRKKIISEADGKCLCTRIFYFFVISK